MESKFMTKKELRINNNDKLIILQPSFKLPNDLEKFTCMFNYNLIDIQPFLLSIENSNLKELRFSFNYKLTEIHALPQSLLINLKKFYCDVNNLTKLPILPNILEVLHCGHNQLTELPKLPNTLKELYCYENKLTHLPELPDTLELLSCGNNPLIQLPVLPDTMELLFCDYTKITELPYLPKKLRYVSCEGNKKINKIGDNLELYKEKHNKSF
jgi:hypothetical protein